MTPLAGIPHPVGGPLGGWRREDVFVRPAMNLEAFIGMSRIAERGKFDGVFLADDNGARDMDRPALFTALSGRDGDEECRPRRHRDQPLRRTRDGRPPDRLKSLPDVSLFTGRSATEADDLYLERQSLISPAPGVHYLSKMLVHDLETLPPDGPLSSDLAVEREDWWQSRAGDRFTIMTPVQPTGLGDFVDLVVPGLQRRGIIRKEYETAPLRGHPGLPDAPSRWPAAAHKAGRGAA